LCAAHVPGGFRCQGQRMKGMDAEVLVAGGGPAGAATASYLAQQGFDVLLLEKARFPREKACAEFLSPGAVDELARLGVLGEVKAAGPAWPRGMRLIAGPTACSVDYVTVERDSAARPGRDPSRERNGPRGARRAGNAGTGSLAGARLCGGSDGSGCSWSSQELVSCIRRWRGWVALRNCSLAGPESAAALAKSTRPGGAVCHPCE
jgi:hypothetical protein